LHGQRTHLYPKIHCPFCKFFTTAAEKLGPHMVDKHSKEIVRGYLKVRTPTSKKRRESRRKP
jgi:glutaredoxin